MPIGGFVLFSYCFASYFVGFNCRNLSAVLTVTENVSLLAVIFFQVISQLWN